MSRRKKKKFKDTDVGKFLLGKAPKALGAILTGRNPLTAILESDELDAEDRTLAIAKLDAEADYEEQLTRRWEADLISGYWLPANVRPIALIVLNLGTLVGWYIQLDGLATVASLAAGFNTLYIGSRGIEKIRKIQNEGSR